MSSWQTCYDNQEPDIEEEEYKEIDLEDSDVDDMVDFMKARAYWP